MNRKFSISKAELQAADWVLKHERGLTAQEQDAFSQWLADNPEHKDLFRLQNTTWDELDRLAGLQTTEYARIDKDLLNFENEEIGPQVRKKFIKTCYVLLPIAACLLIIGSLTLTNPTALFERNPLQPSADQTRIVKSIPRLQKKQLPDGSVVTLNRNGNIKTVFDDKYRRIQLLSGEAHFEVAKDPHHPFIVEAHSIEVVAVGTAFNVRLDDNKIDVIVAEGRVKLCRPVVKFEQPQAPAIEEIGTLEASEQMLVFQEQEDLHYEKTDLTDQSLEERLLWQPKLLEFRDTALVEIVAAFNRRNQVQIKITNPTLAELRLTCVYWSDNIESFIRLLQESFNVKAQWIDGNHIELS